MLAAKGEKGDQIPALTWLSCPGQPYRSFWLPKWSPAVETQRRENQRRRIHTFFSIVGSRRKHTCMGFLLLLLQIAKTEWLRTTQRQVCKMAFTSELRSRCGGCRREIVAFPALRNHAHFWAQGSHPIAFSLCFQNPIAFCPSQSPASPLQGRDSRDSIGPTQIIRGISPAPNP